MNQDLINEVYDILEDSKRGLGFAEYDIQKLPYYIPKITGCSDIIDKAHRIRRNMEQIFEDIEEIKEFLTNFH